MVKGEIIMGIGIITPSIDTRSELEPRLGKLPVKNIAISPGPDNTEFNSFRTVVSFLPYGSRNERIALVVKNQETGEIIREIPAKEIQKLHINLDTFV
jgi:hypothetical protein